MVVVINVVAVNVVVGIVVAVDVITVAVNVVVVGNMVAVDLIDVVVTVYGVVGMVVILSGFFGARMTNLSNRARVIAKITKTIKEMEVILTHRRRHHFCCLLLFIANSMYAQLVCI